MKIFGGSDLASELKTKRRKIIATGSDEVCLCVCCVMAQTQIKKIKRKQISGGEEEKNTTKLIKTSEQKNNDSKSLNVESLAISFYR